jgi:multicomponent Na+:H+ antiporter subunit C
VDDILTIVISRVNWWAYILLMLIGLYGVIIKRNIIKKIIGLSILQTAIILFFISIGAKRGATIPIIEHSHDAHPAAVQATGFINPLPHVLMLTAIVVAVATLGVALALTMKIYQIYGTLDEDEVLTHLRKEGRQ